MRPKTWKNSIIPKLLSENCYFSKENQNFRFSKESPSSLSSPAAKTEFGAQFIKFFVVLMIFKIIKPGTLEKAQVCRGNRPSNGYYGSLFSPAAEI
jgi:hypothetical protein